jgi:cell division protein FtsQ
MGISKRKTGKFISVILWLGVGAALVVLLLAAIRKRDDKTCSGLEIEIKDAQHHLFADKNDIRGMLLHMMPAIKGSPLASFDLRKMEQTLERNVWIKDAELFFDNNEVLRVKIEERKPQARIFTTGGKSYYIDRELTRLPLSSSVPADVPVFTNCPLDKTKWNGADSALLLQVKAISEFISADAFWMAQIEQVNYAGEKRFELYPQIGEHVIVLGDGYNLEQKFRKLYTFYSEVLAKVGWDAYSAIDVQYSKQVVATRKDTTQRIIIQNQLNNINSYATQ